MDIVDDSVRFGRRVMRYALVALLVLGAVGIAGLDVVVGTGDSMEPRFEPCDVILVDTTRDTARQVTAADTIAYRSDSGVIVHEVVGVSFTADSVLASGVNQAVRDRVPSERIIGAVVGHLDTSWLCSTTD